MEIGKAVLQHSTAELLKFHPNLSFNHSIPLHQHQEDIGNVEAMKDVVDNSIDSDNDQGNHNDNSNLLLNEEMEDDSKPPRTIASKQPFPDDDAPEVKPATVATTPDSIDFLKYPSFQQHFSPIPIEISKCHTSTTCRLVQKSSNNRVNLNLINSMNGEIPKLEEEISRSLTKHSTVSSLHSSSSVLQQKHRQSVTLTTASSFAVQNSKNHDFDDMDGMNNHDNDDYLDNPEKALNEKKPRIERPRARYPNSARRTSVQASFWSEHSLLPEQVNVSIFSFILEKFFNYD